MSDQPYDKPEQPFEPDHEPPSEAQAEAQNENAVSQQDDLAPIELEPEHESQPEPKSTTISDLDVCPSCGAALPGAEDVVCMRCGYDLRTLRPLETKATVETESSSDKSPTGEPVVASDRMRVLLSGVLIAASWTGLLIGYMLGVQALMPGAELKQVGEGEAMREIIPAGVRLVSVLKVLVLTGTWVVCATAGLAMFARLVERPFGELRAGLLHLVAIASTMQLVRYIGGIPARSVEWTLEIIAQIVIFFGFSLLLLKLSRRDVLTFALITVIVVLCLFFGSHVLAWAMSS